ncbi:hypothetical protein SNEBB_011085 [Seison nebaliae]|nr:hypothetical protein SNEBB_011085 [Seison nebaliae]
MTDTTFKKEEEKLFVMVEGKEKNTEFIQLEELNCAEKEFFEPYESNTFSFFADDVLPVAGLTLKLESKNKESVEAIFNVTNFLYFDANLQNDRWNSLQFEYDEDEEQFKEIEISLLP